MAGLNTIKHRRKPHFQAKIKQAEASNNTEMSKQSKLASIKNYSVYSFAKKNALLISILISIVIGFCVGLALKSSSWNNTDKVLWFTLPGVLFIRALEMLIVPVIFVGVVSATSALSPKNNIRMTSISFALIMITHFLGTLTAFAGSFILKQIGIEAVIDTANGTQSIDHLSKVNAKTTYDIVSDILRNLIPKNLIKATTHQELTKYAQNPNNASLFERRVEYIDGTNLLGLLVFAVLLGLASSLLEKKAELFREFFRSANEVIILILRWLILMAPIGICCLIIDAVLGVEDLGDSFKKIGLFTGVCIATLVFYVTVVLSLLVFITTRKNPLRLYLAFLEPTLLSFASTSGAVCISKGMDVCEIDLKMDKRLSKFAIPFYTALQADGSAIFIVMACTFLTDYSGVSLGISDYIVISIMAMILCLCLPSVPSSSIITIVVILNGINLSYLNVSIFYTVDWLLDRVRTAVNFYSHCFCTFITNELCKAQFDNEENRESHEKDKLGSLISEVENTHI